MPNRSGLVTLKVNGSSSSSSRSSSSTSGDERSAASLKRRGQQQQRPRHRRRPGWSESHNVPEGLDNATASVSTHSRSQSGGSDVGIVRLLRACSFSTLIFLALLFWSLTLCPEVLGRQSLHQTCPGCPHQQHAHLHRGKDPVPNPDDLRLEAIKHQILSKLGLRSRPDVNRTMATVPKRLALETIYRAEYQSARPPPPQPQPSYQGNRANPYGEYGFGDEFSYKNLDQTQEAVDEGLDQNVPYQDYDDLYGSQHEPEAMDDFYARTSEIITFAEPGKRKVFSMTEDK